MTLWMRPRRNDEADKAVWKDLSGNGNDGTLTNFAFTGASGWASDPPRLVFASDDDYVITAASPDFVLTDVTLEVWCVPDVGVGQQALIDIGNGSISGGACMYLRHAAGLDLSLSTHDDASTRRFATNGTLIYGSRHHIVGLHDGPTLRLYCNGSLQYEGGGTTSAAARYASPRARVGHIVDIAAPKYLDGSVLVARIYNRPLSAAEVAQNYAAGPTGWGYVRDGLVLDLNAAYVVPVLPRMVYASGQEAFSWR